MPYVEVGVYINNEHYQNISIKRAEIADTYKSMIIKNIPNSDTVNLQFVSNKMDTAACAVMRNRVTKSTIIHVNNSRNKLYCEVLYKGFNTPTK